jgi:predicted acetyltransferase
MADVPIRSIDAGELERFMVAEGLAFQAPPDEEDVARERLLAEPDRYFVALEGEAFVGTAGACSTRLTVPGPRSVPAAGITAVGVVPSHRRRGINTALIATLLDQAAERSEAVAFLWASEASIYRRFGFGLASVCIEFEVATEHGRFVEEAPVAGEVRLLPRNEALSAMRPVHERVASARPGMIAIEDRWWTWLFVERKEDREKPPYYVVHHDANGGVDGYAEYRFEHSWLHNVSLGVVEVRQLIAANPVASATLWRYLLDLDLAGTVKAWNRPADEELMRFAAEPRRLNARLADGLWVRLVDPAAALRARGYEADGRLVLEIVDAFRPATSGRYSLEVRDGEAGVERTDAEPEIVCGIEALGATYLGGATFRQLARVRQVRELAPGALARADAIFNADPSPWFGFEF